MRSTKPTLLKTAIALWAAVLFTGCALNPQKIDIHPNPEVEYQNIGKNKSATVRIKDDRSDDHLGFRGGTYPETSVLELNNDLPKVLYETVVQGLHRQGFNVLNPGNNKRQVQVTLEEFDYKPAEGIVVNYVTTSAVIKAEVYENGSKIYSNRYRSETEHKTVVTPNNKKNEELINKELTRTLERVLSDKKLLTALRDGKD